MQPAQGNIFPLFQPSKTFTTEFRGVRYDYYLTGVIREAEDYLDLCNILRTASPQDEVVIHINCPGGSVHVGQMIINAIHESEANVVGFIESECASMATMIFLACSTWGVSNYAEFMAHTCSYGAYGKEHENFDSMQFMRKQQHRRTRESYKNFLTEEEIEKVLSGTDLYLNADEVMERLQTYAQWREEQEQALQEAKEEDTTPSIREMIMEAVREAINNPAVAETPKAKPKRVAKPKAKVAPK